MKYSALLAAGLSCVAALPLTEDVSMLSNLLPVNESEKIWKRDGPVPANVYLEASLSDTSRTPGGKVTTIKYGPWSVGAMSAIENLPVLRVAAPCTECYIVAIQASLENPQGETVNVDTGGWLHHMEIEQTGGGKKDAVCAIQPGQRIFASGNERTAVRTNNKYKYGIDHGVGENFQMVIDLMNVSKNPQQFKISMMYEWIPMAGSGYKAAVMAWNDVAGCISTSEVPARTGQFTLSSNPWASSVTGYLLSATGHEHDGGTGVTVKVDGQTVCQSAQLYGRRAGYTESMNSGDSASGNMGAMSHISDTGSCVDFGTINKGSKMMIDATYDTNEHPLMKRMGGVGNEPIMGISQVYIGPH